MPVFVPAVFLSASIASNSASDSADREQLRLAASAVMKAPIPERYAAWERVVEAAPGSRTAACAMLEMARIRQHEDRVQDAVPLLVRARDTDARVAPLAQWRLALALVEMGDYETALDALHRSEHELTMVTMGHSFAEEYALWEGFSLEHLGRVDEAIGHYLHVFTNTRVMAHLLDLYEGAGQLDDLERILTERSSGSAAEYSQAVPALTLLVMRRVAQAGEWATLIPILQDRRLRYPWGSELADSGLVEATEALKLLTRSCDRTVPHLVRALESSSSPWVFHALGICATPDAVATLKSIARDEHGVSAGLARLALEQPSPRRQPRMSEGPLLVFPPARSQRLPTEPQLADHAVRIPEFPTDTACVW